MSERASGAGVRARAVVAVVAYCAIPVLVSAGVLATVGAVLGNRIVITAAMATVAGSVLYAPAPPGAATPCPMPERATDEQARDRP